MRARAAIGAVLTAAAIAAVVVAPAGAGREAPPRILGLEYYEDREDGYRYNVVATVKRRATEVRARIGDRRAEGRRSGHVSTTGPGKLWFFRERGFVRAVREALEAEGMARVSVLAAGDAGTARKRCRLELEIDPIYGGFATGECRAN